MKLCKSISFTTFAAMDSLTQIVLGAACGEFALGKKIGNKALLFGVIGGTIPDLDVFIGKLFYSNSIDIMTFHRGFMHSLTFAFLGAFIFGYILYKLYNSGKRLNTTTKKDWTWLFFLSLFTHPILDSFTPYGTQIFAPFSDYRVAFNNISVLDPLYTIPFLICMIVVLFFKRTNSKRIKWTKVGIYISSAYMLFTIGNKFYMDAVFKKSFEKANISYLRYRTQPTILNNFLWYGIAETKTNYKIAYYSIFDRKNTADKIITIVKDTTILDQNNTDLKRLTWFSDHYYLIDNQENTTKIIYKDLRYVMLTKQDSVRAIMNFEIQKNGSRLETKPTNNFNPSEGFFSTLWNRIKGV
ncbi:MAG: inner membrane protein [Polaribacter sp.]|jgi:inner membrane protein